MKKEDVVRNVLIIMVGAGLFVALTEVRIPLANNIALQIRMGLISFISAVLGPVIGGVVAVIGHAIGDQLFDNGIYWSWVVADGVYGIIIGLFSAKYQITKRHFRKKEIGLFNVVQIIANVIAWIGVAPTLDILLMDKAPSFAYLQGVMACSTNVIVVAVLGTLLNYIYSVTFTGE